VNIVCYLAAIAIKKTNLDMISESGKVYWRSCVLSPPVQLNVGDVVELYCICSVAQTLVTLHPSLC